MIIRRDAWHYRYLEWLGGVNFCPPKTLCSYVWTLVLVGGVMPGLILFIGVGMAVLVWMKPWQFALGAVGVGFIVFVCFGMPALMERLRYRTPGLLRQWVRAKKAKVCPLIEYR